MGLGSPGEYKDTVILKAQLNYTGGGGGKSQFPSFAGIFKHAAQLMFRRPVHSPAYCHRLLLVAHAGTPATHSD